MKYFCVSDIHSFFTPFKKALIKAGFDKDNPEHCLVVLGDIFDRGYETRQVYNFLSRLSADRCILIKGNHEWLYKELLKKSFPEDFDFSNGTVRTFCAIAGMPDAEDILKEGMVYWYSGMDEVDRAIEVWSDIQEKVKRSRITKFIKSARWMNYFELDKYVFVHAFIPVDVKKDAGMFKNWPLYEISASLFEYDKDWRTAADWIWDEATWLCPFTCYKNIWDANESKILVVGHWHTADFFKYFNAFDKADNYYSCPIFNGSTYACGADKLIALDARTVANNKVNVLVIEG